MAAAKKWLQMGSVWHSANSTEKGRSERGVNDGKRESSQSVDQSLQAWPLGRGLCSGRDHRPAAMLKPSQAHSER